jgi:uncharacterized protein
MDSTYKQSRYIVETTSRDEKYALLFNTRTGALVQLPNVLRPELSRFLEVAHNDKSLEQTRLFRVLLQGGFIVEFAVNELEEIRRSYSRRINRSVLNLSVMPTLACNMACPYCFEQHRNISMDKKGADSLVRFIKARLSGINELSADWYGGEPLLKADFIILLQNRIDSLCKQYGTKSTFSMTTNGYLLTPKRCDTLVSEGVQSFQVTIDGPKRIHDARRFLKGGTPTFDRIVSNLSYAVERVAVNIRVNVDRTNIAHLKEMIKNLSCLGLQGAETLSFKAVVPPGGHDELGLTFSMPEFAEVLQGVADKASDAGFKVYTEPRDVCEFCPVDLPEQWIIGPDLYVYKCADTFDPMKDAVGRIAADGSLHLNETLNLWRSKPIFDDPNCRECVYLPQCMGGCSLKKLIHGKDWCPEERFALSAYVQRLYQSSQRGKESKKRQQHHLSEEYCPTTPCT